MTATWWDDPAATQAVLSAVDDEQPEVGAGVVLLGLHGLGSSALRAAAPSFSLDPASVVTALDEMDLHSVSQAWRRAGGDLEDLELMKSDADVAAFRTISMLRQMGVDPQTAVHRAATLYGLPAKSAVSVVAKFHAETGPAADAAAIGEVMHYAASLGSDVLSKAYDRRGFHGDDPDERDEDGRFAPKGRPASRAQAQVQAQAAPERAPAPSRGRYIPVASNAAERGERRRKREKRQAREAAARAGSLTQSAPNASSTQQSARSAQTQAGADVERTSRVKRERTSRTQRAVRTRTWHPDDGKVDVGAVMLASGMRWDQVLPGGPDPEHTYKLMGTMLYTFVPTTFAHGWDRPMSLHAVQHAMRRDPHAHTSVETVGKVYTYPQITQRLHELADAGALEQVVRGENASMFVNRVPMSLVVFRGGEFSDPDDRVLHPGTMLDFNADPSQGPAGKSHYDMYPFDDEESGESSPAAIRVFDAMNLHTVPAHGPDLKDSDISKAYERRGYHGDDPDERDSGGRFAARGRAVPAAEAVAATERKPGTYIPVAHDATARTQRRRKRQARQARAAAIAAATTTPAPASAAVTTQQRAQGEQTTRTQRVTRTQRTQRMRPTRAAGTPRIPSDAPPWQLLNLDESESAVSLVSATDEAHLWNLVTRMAQTVSRGDHTTPEDAWRAMPVEQVKLADPELASEFGDAGEFGMSAANTDELKHLLTRRSWAGPQGSRGLHPVSTVSNIIDDVAWRSGRDTRTIERLVDSVDVDTVGADVLIRYTSVPPGFASDLVDSLAAGYGTDRVSDTVTVVTNHAGDLQRAVDRSRVRAADVRDVGAVTGTIRVSKPGAPARSETDQLWLVLDRVRPEEDSRQSSASVFWGDARAMVDDAATAFVYQRPMTVADVAAFVGVKDEMVLKYPASLGVGLVVIEHRGGAL